MGIPEEDKGPAWLRDYGEKSGNLETDTRWGYQVEKDSFAVDLKGLQEFGAKLKTELEQDYVPHANTAVTYMATEVTVLPEAFLELCSAVDHQSKSLDALRDHLTRHYEAVKAFAEFATKMATTYGNVDATAEASVRDVETNLGAQPVNQTGGGK
jgi:hypothetical protein